jgi:hypothetical protein
MRLPSASTRKFSSSSIMAAAEHKPDTDQRILDLNLTDQGYRVAHATAVTDIGCPAGANVAAP